MSHASRHAAPHPPARGVAARSTKDVLAGLAALAAIVVLLVGVPYGLLTFFGSPIPESMPTARTLTQRIDSDTLMYVLVVLVWLAWLQLTVCVLVEAYAAVRGVGVPTRIPLAGGPQALAHRLVVAALLLFSATSAVVPAFVASTHQAHLVTTRAQDHAQRPATPATVEQATRQVVQGLGEHPTPKHTVRKIYRVRPPEGRHHQSLWEIAEQCLGNGRRYREIYQLNKGKLQPDGGRLTMASLIRPGWVLDMPDDATGVEIIDTGPHDGRHEHGVPHSEVPGGVHHHGFVDTEEEAVEAAEQAQHEQEAERAQHEDAETRPAPPVGEDASDHREKAPADDTPPNGHDRRPDSETHAQPPPDAHVWGWPQQLALASLLAAGLLAALGRRRREQLWHRAFGQMITHPEREAALAEQALRIGADPRSVRLLDLGTRLLSRALAAEGRSLPTVYGAHLGPDSLDLWIGPADSNPPEPWQAYDNGQVWRLRANALDERAVAGLDDVLAPYPGLVSIGTNETGRVLVDLEAAHGLIAVSGPAETRRAVLAAVAVELATNRWSDHMRITLVGFGDELVQVAPDRVRAVDTLWQALPELESRTEEVRRALAASGADSVLTGRCRGVFGEAWTPHYLIMAEPPTREERERLVELARTGRRMAAGYIVAADGPADSASREDTTGAAWSWEVDADGRLRAGVLGFDVAAQLVPDRQYRAVVELFRTAGRVDGVAYAEPDTEPAVPPAAAGPDPGARPTVDVRLLGPVEVDAPGAVDDDRRSLCTEAVAYLAVHPEGVHPAVLGAALWPRGVTDGVRDAAVTRVTEWLGNDSRGRPNVYYDERGRIRLGSEVRVDWAMFRWLVWRSAAEPVSETAYLSHALDLVRGPLLDGRPGDRYAWLAVEDLEYEAVARVADVAHRLALMRLDDGDAPGAAGAARAGLRLVADDQGLWRDLLRATHATGDHAQVRTVVDLLRGRVEAGPSGDRMQPETEALVEEILPRWRATGVLPGRHVAAGGA